MHRIEADLAISAHDGFSTEETTLDFEAQPNDDARTRILDLLSTAPLSIDDLVREARLPTATVQWVLVELEIADAIARTSRGDVLLSAGG